MADPWLIHFFRRHREDDPSESTPAMEFLEAAPDKVAAEIQAVLEAVAEAPPSLVLRRRQMGGHAR